MADITDYDTIIQPCSKFQQDYLTADENILLVGGAAGSSKTHVGLMRHLRFIEDPMYRGYVIRKNSTAIMASGGLFDAAVHLYSKYSDIKIRVKDQKIVFPHSKAEISFSHYENRNAAMKFQGLEISNIMYDEATHAEEEDIWWLISRLRSKAKNKPSIWLTCNPDPDSWLFKYAFPYLNPVGHPLAGRPAADKNGWVRWILRVDGNLVWADSREELVLKYGRKDLPLLHDDQVKPKSFRCLFGTIDDNPVLQKTNPDYKATLESLPNVERERLRYGNWFARAEASGFFKRGWVNEVTEYPEQSDIVKIVRAWDIAGELASPKDIDPDYTVGVKMAKLKNGQYIILDVVRFRARYGDVKNRIIGVATEDGVGVDIIIPQDPNASGKAASKMLAQEIINEGFSARTVATSKSKIDRFRPFASTAENGNVSVLKNCCTCLENKIYGDNSFYYNELEKFDGGRKGHDDLVDATSDAFMRLAKSQSIPSFLGGLQSFNTHMSNPLNNF